MALAAAVVSLSLILSTSYAQMNTVTYPDFMDSSALQIFGSALRYTHGSVRLTARPNQAGGFVLRAPFLLLAKQSPNSSVCLPLSWSTTFTFIMNGPADGIAFVIWSKLRNLGSAAGFLGYGGTTRYKSPSMAIEFDTFKDAWDPNGQHIGIDEKGSVKSVITAGVPSGMTLNSNKPVTAWIDYDGQKISVFVAPQGANKPNNPSLKYAVNLCKVLDQPGYYIGFTASSGRLAASSHDILSWSFSAQSTKGLCDVCGSFKDPKEQVPCCMPFSCCNGICLAPTELCAGTTCCGNAASGRVCWGNKCCSVTSLCLNAAGNEVCCPKMGDSSCCM